MNNVFYFPTTVLKENNGEAISIYRSIISEANCNSTNIENLEYRRADKVNTFGRINSPNQAYFYACDNARTCWSELNNRIKLELNQNEEIAIITSQWTLGRDLKLCVIPDWNNRSMDTFTQKIESYNLSQEQINVLKEINELFLSEDNNSNIHKKSSAFCNAILFDAKTQNKNLDGFLYTSVKDGKGYNLALFPHLIDNKDVVLKAAVKTCISKNNIQKDEYNFKPYIEAKIDIENGKINW